MFVFFSIVLLILCGFNTSSCKWIMIKENRSIKSRRVSEKAKSQFIQRFSWIIQSLLFGDHMRRIHTHTCTYKHTFTKCTRRNTGHTYIHTYICMHTHTFIHKQNSQIDTFTQVHTNKEDRKRARTRTHTYTHIHTHTNTQVRRGAQTYTCLRGHMHTQIHRCMHIHFDCSFIIFNHQNMFLGIGDLIYQSTVIIPFNSCSIILTGLKLVSLDWAPYLSVNSYNSF